MQQFSESECSICLLLLVQPVRLSCGHVICLSCSTELMDSYCEKIKCPLCRQVTIPAGPLQIDLELQKSLKQQKPKEFEQAETHLKKIENDDSQIKLKLIYGNRHKEIQSQSSNKHQWAVYAELINVTQNNATLVPNPQLLIKEVSFILSQVTFTLHPTFHPPKITIKQAPFELERIGWGVFTIKIEITFAPGLGLPTQVLEHYLSFNGEGEKQSQAIKIDKSKLPRPQ